MARLSVSSLRAACVIAVVSAGLAGCASTGGGGGGVARVRLSDRECMARAMYFESNRSSDAGMIAVGTVVMNRVKAGKYGNSVCQVVGAPKQFAPGVLTRSMNDRGAPRAYRNAELVLAGKRHAGVKQAEFFHTHGYRYPYRNMKYVLVAGGNAFYEKRKPPKNMFGGEGSWGGPPAPTEDMGEIMVASAPRIELVHDREAPAVVARRDELPSAPPPLVDRRLRSDGEEIRVARAERRRLGGRPEAEGMYDETPVSYEVTRPSRMAPPVQVARIERRPAPVQVAVAEPVVMPAPVVAPRIAPQPIAVAAARPAPIQLPPAGEYAVASRAAPAEIDRRADIQPVRQPARPRPVREESYRVARNDVAPPPVVEEAARPRREWREETRVVESRPLPAPEPRAPEPIEIARAPDVYDAPAPQRPKARAPRQIEPTETASVEASAAALGWRAGPAPVVDYDTTPRR